MQNQEIRQAIDAAGIRYWEVADIYGISDGNFSRKLRKELPQTEKERILAIVDKLKAEKAVSA